MVHPLFSFLRSFFSSDFTDESEAFLLIGLLTDFRGYLASGQWLAPEIFPYCFCHADFANDADFIHRMTRNLFGDFLLRRLLTDFHGCDLSGRCRYPLRLTKRFTRDSIKNLCISVKSVGQKTTGAYIGRQPLVSGQSSAKFRE